MGVLIERWANICQRDLSGTTPLVDIPLSTLNPQPSTFNPQPSNLDPQPSTLNPPPSTLDPVP